MAHGAFKRMQDKHHGVLESKDITDDHRSLLLDAGFIRPVIKGWYPWTVVRVKRRMACLEALDDASARGAILSLVLFLKAELEQWTPERDHSWSDASGASRRG